MHSHGGVVLEHLKTLGLHSDLRPGEKLLVVGSTSWVVWNMLVSGLLRGARRSSCSTAIPRIPTSTACGGSPRTRA